MKETTKMCPKCGTPIPSESPMGLCPKCVLADAAEPTGASPSRPAPPPIDRIQSAFPQLEVVELIGTGGMGAVFKARQPKLDRFVALKVLPETLASVPGFSDRFGREAR
jgi:serine/threonine protein kinase